MSKEFKTRIQHKHDLEVNWLKATNFIPLPGEIIVYDSEIDPTTGEIYKDYEGNALLPSDRFIPYSYSRVKIGNGDNVINDLPFFNPAIELLNGKADAIHFHNISDVVDLESILNSYILYVDYYKLLSFDTNEIVINTSSTSSTSILGKAILGQMVLS